MIKSNKRELALKKRKTIASPKEQLNTEGLIPEVPPRVRKFQSTISALAPRSKLHASAAHDELETTRAVYLSGKEGIERNSEMKEVLGAFVKNLGKIIPIAENLRDGRSYGLNDDDLYTLIDLANRLIDESQKAIFERKRTRNGPIGNPQLFFLCDNLFKIFDKYTSHKFRSVTSDPNEDEYEKRHKGKLMDFARAAVDEMKIGKGIKNSAIGEILTLKKPLTVPFEFSAEAAKKILESGFLEARFLKGAEKQINSPRKKPIRPLRQR